MSTRRRSGDKTIIAAVIGVLGAIIAALIPVMLNQKHHPDPTGSILVSKDEEIVKNLKISPGEVEDITGTGQTDDPIVYRTKSGKCYHRENCSYIKKGGIALRLSEAKKFGLKPCKKCKPPG